MTENGRLILIKCTVKDLITNNTIAEGVVDNIKRKMSCHDHEDKQLNATGFVAVVET